RGKKKLPQKRHENEVLRNKSTFVADSVARQSLADCVPRQKSLGTRCRMVFSCSGGFQPPSVYGISPLRRRPEGAVDALLPDIPPMNPRPSRPMPPSSTAMPPKISEVDHKAEVGVRPSSRISNLSKLMLGKLSRIRSFSLLLSGLTTLMTRP